MSRRGTYEKLDPGCDCGLNGGGAGERQGKMELAGMHRVADGAADDPRVSGRIQQFHDWRQRHHVRRGRQNQGIPWKGAARADTEIRSDPASLRALEHDAYRRDEHERAVRIVCMRRLAVRATSRERGRPRVFERGLLPFVYQACGTPVPDLQ